MGRESEIQKIKIETLEAMLGYLRDAISGLDRAVEISRRNGIETLDVRQLPKGKKAFEDILNFTSLLNASIVKQILPQPPKQKPLPKDVSYEITKRRQQKVAENKKQD